MQSINCDAFCVLYSKHKEAVVHHDWTPFVLSLHKYSPWQILFFKKLNASQHKFLLETLSQEIKAVQKVITTPYKELIFDKNWRRKVIFFVVSR